MDEKKYSTVGRVNYQGMEVKLSGAVNVNSEMEEIIPDRFRIIYIKEGFGTFHNGKNSQVVTAPAVLCINHTDHVKLIDSGGMVVDRLIFDPACFERYIPYNSIEEWRQASRDDAHFFRAFFTRDENFIGACITTKNTGQRITQLISKAIKLLEDQIGDWPCRSRSYFIELLLLTNSIYDEDEINNTLYAEGMTDEIREVVNWLNSHFNDKIVLEDVTKLFHTNKTTLNEKFKAVLGLTVTEYVINLRMQIACSCLRKTMLSIQEIISRTGYRDDAHFLRTFKKHIGCTPTEYRSRYEVSG